MRIYLLILMLTIGFTSACKTKQKVAVSSETKNENTNQEITVGKTTGKVSHQYKSTGCNTVINIIQNGEDKPNTLIPNIKLPDDLDKDGLEITFDYRPLKMPNPAGCMVGMPAEITNIAKANIPKKK